MNNYPGNPNQPENIQPNNPWNNNSDRNNIPRQFKNFSDQNNSCNPNLANNQKNIPDPNYSQPPSSNINNNSDSPIPGTPKTANPNKNLPQKENDNKQKKNLEPASLKALKQLGQNNPPSNVESDIHTIPIVGQIEGHLVLPPKNKTTKYEHIIPQLVAVEENPKIKGLLLLLNTVGGDIEAGLAISEMISSMNKPTISIVLGGGHSIGIPVAVATDYSLIVPTASMTIHPIRLSGKIIGVPQTYEYLNKMQDRIISFVIKHSAINEKSFRNLMFQTGELVRDVGTVLIGKEAVEEGIIQQVGGLAMALNKLRTLIDEKSGDDNND